MGFFGTKEDTKGARPAAPPWPALAPPWETPDYLTMEPGICMLPPPALAFDLFVLASAFEDEVLPPAPEPAFVAAAPARVDDLSI